MNGATHSPSTQETASEEARDRKHWRAFWDEIPAWLKTAVIALLAAGGGVSTGFIGNNDKPAAGLLENRLTRLEERLLKVEINLDGVIKTTDKMDSKLDRLILRRDR